MAVAGVSQARMPAGVARGVRVPAPGSPRELLGPLVLQIVTIGRLYGHDLQSFPRMEGRDGPHGVNLAVFLHAAARYPHRGYPRYPHHAYAHSDDGSRRLANQAFFKKVFIDEDNELRVEHNRPFEMLLHPQVNANALTWAADTNKARTSTKIDIGKGSGLVHWWSYGDSNPGPSHCERDALPTAP